MIGFPLKLSFLVKLGTLELIENGNDLFVEDKVLGIGEITHSDRTGLNPLNEWVYGGPGLAP